MPIRRDIKTTEEGDIILKDGDFEIWASDPQHIDLAMKSSKGMWKQWPTFGAGLDENLNSSAGKNTARRKIINTLSADEYGKITVDIIEENIYVNAKFKRDDN